MRFFLLKILLAPLFFIQSTTIIAQIDSLLLEYEYYTLKNGLEVVLQPDSSVEDVAVEFWIKDGSRIDKPEQYGLSHFFEHVMPFSKIDKVTRKNLSKNTTDNNAQIRKDFIRFYTKVKPIVLESALKMTAGRLKADTSRITPKRVENERKRVLSEIKRNSRNPLWSAPGSLAIYKGTFGENTLYGGNGYGTVENNESFKLGDFRKRYHDIVYANNIILFVVGNFNVDNVKSLIQNYFESIPSKKKVTLKKNKLKKKLRSTKFLEMKSPNAKDTLNTLVYSWPVPKWGTNDEGTLKIIAEILNRRFRNKSLKSSLIVNIYVGTDIFQFKGQFYVRASFSMIKDAHKIENLILDEIQKISNNLITIEELKLAQQEEIKDLKNILKNLGFQNSRTELLGEGLLFRGNPAHYFSRFKNQLKTKRREIRRVTQKWLMANHFKVMFITKDKT